ncbi:hypothetical protein [Paroceanicella profunda]|uniref:hypothetical protein n=1 Tax=Paroceanicella profunda TaxID=2579971 RepID=UPI001478EAE3|nr:hypothetical protein [Paroceanicella profunda]
MEADFAYWVVIGAGGLTLILEAFRQFSNPLTLYVHDRYPILQGVQFDSLCTRAELLRGLFFYVLIYLAIYAVLLSSAELYGLLQAADPDVRGSTGNIPGDDGVPLLDETAYGKPFYVSATIIAALSTGVFAPAERAARTVAHWLANIPQGAYRTITRLHRVDYLRLGAHSYQPLSDAYRALMPRGPEEDSAAQSLHEDALHALVTIDLLRSSVVGEQRDQIFAQYPNAMLQQLAGTVRGEIDALSAALAQARTAPQSLPEVRAMAARTRDNLLALFAVLFIRNHRRAAVDPETPLGAVVERVRSARDPLYNSLAGATLLSVFLTICGTSAIYYLFPRGAEHWLTRETFGTLKWNWEIAYTAMWYGFGSGLGLGATAGLALLIREARLESAAWRPWRFRRMPCLRFFYAALAPAALTVVACFLTAGVEDFLRLGYLTKAQVRDLLEARGPFCALTFVFGLIVAFGVFIVADQHERLPAWGTLAAALCLMPVYMCWAFLLALRPDAGLDSTALMLRETALYTLPTLVFFVAFVLLVELGEEEA